LLLLLLLLAWDIADEANESTDACRNFSADWNNASALDPSILIQIHWYKSIVFSHCYSPNTSTL
jgi:hypothetical protein